MKTFQRLSRFVICLCFGLLFCVPVKGGDKLKPYKVPMLSPEDALKSFVVADGYRMELVACEPMIEEPVALAWDGNGRMYVAEMRTYMQEIDGRDQFRPISRVVRMEDTDGDGRMDKHSVFVDKLVLPRMILPLEKEVIIRETNTLDLWAYSDHDGDGVADEKKLWHKGGGRGGNLEHQPSGLVWNIDNWIYTTYSNHRYRFTRGKVERHSLPGGSGQWGLTHDDVGKLYYSTAGGEQPAMDFQQPMIYGRIRMGGELAPGFREVFPIDDVPDVQGGRGRVRANNTLNNFTGCGGQGVYRGDRLPEDMRGDLFIPEAVGRLVRRAKITNVAGKTVLVNAYKGREFIATKDPNFRPLAAKTGPDGCLYILDMYRGIIQEGNWVRRGSYLRGVVSAYGLDKNIGKGRIYRVVHDKFKPGPRPRMLDEKTSTLVSYLSHPNGWWRDEAQKLIIIRRDESVVPALKKLARSAAAPLSRLHALWTLEGLDVIDKELLREKFSDKDARVRAGAIRISEPLLVEKDKDVIADLAKLVRDEDPNVTIQVILSAQYTALVELEGLAEAALDRHEKSDAVQSILRGFKARLVQQRELRRREEALRKANEEFGRSYAQGHVVYATLCVTCHGQDGKGVPMPDDASQMRAPPLAGSPRVTGKKSRVVRILLHGLQGPVDGKEYKEQMVPMGSNDDAWIAAALNYTRNTWGNKAPYVSTDDVASARSAGAGRATPWTLAELLKFDPRLGEVSKWKLTASHGGNAARSAIDGNPASRWATNTPMQPGMWFQIELPKAQLVRGLSLDSAGSALDHPAGYEVRVSEDGKQWSKVLASGSGSYPETEIAFAPVNARYIKLTQTGHRSGKFWSIHELGIFRAVDPASAEPAAKKAQALPPVSELLKMKGDAGKGKLVFEKNCILCHQVGDKGVNFGPNLSDVGLRLKREQILQSILNPNAVVDKKYLGVLLQTRKGQFLTGFIEAEVNGKVMLRQQGGKLNPVPAASIALKIPQKKTFMPLGLEKAMTTDEFLGLVEYLVGRKEKPAPAATTE
ncbi:MAG: discoidin domain-containing protein [Planctomycetota bacterium]|nr:discoidin domain-containing protein [Planctomycetota bacterium]